MNGGSKAGFPQAAVLISAPLFSLLGVFLIAPVMAKIQRDFSQLPNADVMVPLLLTAPALFQALLSPVAGILGDRFGARRILLGSLLVYGLAGTAPSYLGSFYAILASRLIVGVAEAGLVSCAMTLLSLYFSGDTRQKWLAYQNAFLPWSAAALIAVTGHIGDYSWRTAFLMYGLSFVAFTVGAFVLFDPVQRSHEAPHDQPAKERLAWGRLVKIATIAIPGSLAFYIAPTQLPYLLEGLGITTPSTGADITAISLIVGPLGALASRKLTRLSVGKVLAIAMLSMGVGLILMGAAASTSMLSFGLIVQQIGGSLMFVTAMTYVLSLAQPGQQGLYSGAWWFFYMVTQFVSPLVSKGLIGLAGTRALSVVLAGALAILLCAWLVLSSSFRASVVAAGRNGSER